MVLLYHSECSVHGVAVTEREVHCGMLQSDDPANTSFCITRRITNLTENIHYNHAHKFIDVVALRDSYGVIVDVDAQQMLSTLRQRKIASVLGAESIAHFDITWHSPQDTSPNEDAVYLSEFMEVFESRMLELIERGVSVQQSVTCDSHVVEILQHLTVCKQRSQVSLTTAAVMYTCLYVCLSVCVCVLSDDNEA